MLPGPASHAFWPRSGPVDTRLCAPAYRRGKILSPRHAEFFGDRLLWCACASKHGAWSSRRVCTLVRSLSRTLAAQIITGPGVTMRSIGGEFRVRVPSSASSRLLRCLASVEATPALTPLNSRDLSTAVDLHTAHFTSGALRTSPLFNSGSRGDLRSGEVMILPLVVMCAPAVRSGREGVARSGLRSLHLSRFDAAC